jgi:hypothetical protein
VRDSFQAGDRRSRAAAEGRAGGHARLILGRRRARRGWGRGPPAHPLGVKGLAYRRVKNDEKDAADLADLLRMGRLPEAWLAPPGVHRRYRPFHGGGGHLRPDQPRAWEEWNGFSYQPAGTAANLAQAQRWVNEQTAGTANGESA